MFDGPCGPNDVTTLANALRISCNTAFGQLGIDLGGDALREQAMAFGFDTPLSVPLRVEESTVPEGLNPPQSAQAAIGQFDVRVTPLQVAMVSAAIANDGVLMEPQLVRTVRAPDLQVVEDVQPQPLGQPVSAETAEALTQMMVGVVEDGSGTAARIADVGVAGKTGTAQTGNDTDPHAWFTSFAPADDPQGRGRGGRGERRQRRQRGQRRTCGGADRPRGHAGGARAMSEGLLLGGRYRLLDEVAAGAMGQVWRGHDDRLDREVAVKVLRPELADDPDFLDRFRTEARHAASVRHPHVAAVHDYGEDAAALTGGAATAYLVMDLLDGHDARRGAPGRGAPAGRPGGQAARPGRGRPRRRAPDRAGAPGREARQPRGVRQPERGRARRR